MIKDLFFLDSIISDFSHLIAVSSSGTVKYSAVKAFLKKKPNMVAEYKSIVTLKLSL